METRPLDPVRDWPFFDSDERPSEEDLRVIRPLTESAACALWSQLVSTEPAERHPMLLPANHWLQPRPLAGADWVKIWNAPRIDPDPIVALLDERLPWQPEHEVVFIWMRERAATLPWASFRRIWRAFLFDDEAPFLISLQSPQVISFFPGGGLGFCLRPIDDVSQNRH